MPRAVKYEGGQYLDSDQLKALAKVAKDIFYFANFIYVVNPVKGRVRFDLYPFQKALLYNFLKNRFNIILKFRQAGVTELISMYCLWLAMYHPNKKINIISIKDTVAKKVLKKIKFMYKNLPWYLQTPIVNGRTGEFGSASTMEFSNGSFIESIPTSDQAGRSESLSLLVIDEAAIVRWASTIWASAFPTLSCSVGSTKLFKRIYVKNRKYTKAKTEVIKLRDICPKQVGVWDISKLGYHTLTHSGEWRLITHSQNKGRLETWFVEDNRGKRGGYTPAHRLFTTKGWKTVSEIIENDLNIISVDTKVNKLKSLKPTEKPKKEMNSLLTGISNDKLPDLLKRGRILEMAKEGYSYREIAKEVYPGYRQSHKFVKRILTERTGRVYISKLTVVKKTVRTIYDIQVEGEHSYISANNFVNHNTGGSAIINSCITGNTKIITDKGLLKIRDICPKSFGAVDLSMVSNLRVLTHRGEWKRVIASVNKGRLETWKIQDKFGNTLKCTPDHKLYTLKGFMSVRDIVESHEEVILYHTGISDIQKPPTIQWPDKEEWKFINGYKNYQISNRGEIKYLRSGKWYKKELRPNKEGYVRVTLHKDNSTKKYRIAELVISHFTNFKVGDNEVIDHIDCIPSHNWVTNLRVISRKENTRRASLYSYGLKLGVRTGKGFSDLDSIATIKRAMCNGEFDTVKRTDFINSHNVFSNMSLESARSYVSKVISGNRGKQVELSPIKVVRKFEANIYDITVEDHHSYITYNYHPNKSSQEFNFINKNTPYGIGNFYHSTYVDALAGGNPFNPIRLRWQMHPERDENWYEEMSAALGPKRTAQEIDGDFLSSGNTVFDLADIKAIEDTLPDYNPIKTRFGGAYREFNEPDSLVDYFIGADCASGRSTDYSSFTCMDRSGEEVAIYKGKIPLGQYAKLLGDTGQKFNFAMLAPETNDIGMAVTTQLQDEGYPNLYYSTKILKEKGKSKPTEDKIPGWLTTQKNRSLIVEGLEEDIRNDNIVIKDPFFVQEAYTFIYDGSLRPVARGKHRVNNSSVDIDLEGECYSDDDIFGKAITNHVRKNSKFNNVVLPE